MISTRQLIRLVIDAMKCVPCEDCKRYYPPCVMDFDHLYHKKINIAEAVWRWNTVSKLMKEIDKCEVVCSNCHRVRTQLRRIRKMETEKKKMTRDEVTAMLKTRTKADGTPFKKHEGPRKRKAVTAEGLKSALSAVQDNTARIQLVQAFGIDGRRALSELADTDEGLKPLLRAAFPGAGTGRPYQDSIKTTVDGKAVVSGFDNSVRVKVQRNEDGTVVLSPLAADSAEAKALDAADAALAQYALAQ